MKHTGAWLAAPAVFYVALLFVGPAATVLAYSFCQRDFYGGVVPSVSWQAWHMATDAVTLSIVARTILLAAGVTIANVVIAYPCAAALARIAPSQRSVLILIISFPLVTSALLRTYGWMNVLPLWWRGNLVGVGLVLVFNYLPFMLLPLVKAMERTDQSLMHAALDLGAAPLWAFWRVTVPLTLPAAASGSALVFIPVCGEYLIPHFIGDGKLNLLGTLVMEWFGLRHWPYAAACAAWLAAIVIIPMAAALLWRTTAERETGKHEFVFNNNQQ
jgi:ABC-type spermidine/putrescine transport system permease subunit I